VHVADTINEQLLAAMTKPAPPLASLVSTVPIPVLEVVDKSLQYAKEERWADARAMQRAIRDAYQAVTGVAPTSVTLAFDDTDTVAHADTIVLSSTKMPTSLTAAHDSSDFPKKRASRQWSKIAWILTLCGVGIGGYSYLSQRNATGVASPFGELDSGISSITAVDFSNPFASADPAPSASASPEQAAVPGSTGSPGPSRVETPPVEPENIDPVENAPVPADSVAAPSKSVDDVPPAAPRAAVPPPPAHTATPAAPATKPATAVTHKPAPPPPRPAPPVRRAPPPPPPAPRPFRRP
jgi:serine/threonine-protein kinase